MLEEAISTEMIKLCINTNNSNAMNPNKEALAYFTHKNLKKLKNWDEWKAGEKKQIDQFIIQGMLRDPIHPIGFIKNKIILHPY